MIKQVYTSDDVKKLNAVIRKFLIIDIALIALALGVGIATCLLVNGDNARVFETIDITLSSVCGCVALYYIFNYIAPVRARKNYIVRVLNSPAKTVRGRVAGKGKRITALKYMIFCELTLFDEEGNERLLYWDIANGEPEFEGHIVELKAVNNKIVAYGDAE